MKLKRALAFVLLTALLLTAFPMAADLTPRDKSKKLKMIVVGNSFSYYNDMGRSGGMLQKMAESAGYEVEITEMLKSGYRLDEHLDTDDTYSRWVKQLTSHTKCDIILIQDNGKVGSGDLDAYYNNCKRFKDIADKMGAELFLYQTFGPADDYKSISRYGKDYFDAEMKSRANAERVGAELGITVAYAGAAFTKVHRENPELEMHYTDRHHPNALGSYVMACEIFGTIFGVDPTALTYNGPATEEQAKMFREAASYVLKNGPQVDPAYSQMQTELHPAEVKPDADQTEQPYEEEKLPFTDVQESDWFYKELRELYMDGVINGMTETTFVPNGTLTWGQTLKLISCAIANGSKGGTEGHWASGYLAYARANKWLTGIENVELDRPITRVELCRVCANAKKVKAQQVVNPFTDCDDEAVLALYAVGVIDGMTETTFQPDSLLTRAQISKIIYRLKVL